MQIALGRLFHLVTKSQKSAVFLLAGLFLPGTLIHELSHAIMAGVLLVHVGAIELIPEIRENGVKLGSVQIGLTDPFRRALIGVAPVIFGVAILIASLLYLFSNLNQTSHIPYSIWIIILYIIFVITNTMFSSPKDLEGTFGVLGFIICLFAGLYLLQFNQVFEYIGSLFTAETTEFLKKANLVLLIPIIIDLLVWGFVKLIMPKYR